MTRNDVLIKNGQDDKIENYTEVLMNIDVNDYNLFKKDQILNIINDDEFKTLFVLKENYDQFINFTTQYYTKNKQKKIIEKMYNNIIDKVRVLR